MALLPPNRGNRIVGLGVRTAIGVQVGRSSVLSSPYSLLANKSTTPFRLGSPEGRGKNFTTLV